MTRQNSKLVSIVDKLISSPEPAGKLLQSSELQYRRLFETAQDGILLLDADTGKITEANPFLIQLLGYSQKELIGKELWEIGVSKDIIKSKAAFFELQTSGYIRYNDLPLQTKDGRHIEVEFICNLYMVNRKKVIQCNIRDITARTILEKLAKSRAEELEILAKSQEQTKQAMLNVMEDLEAAKTLIEVEKVKDEAMLASIGEGFIAVDNDRKILIVNKAAENMLGWKMKDMVGKEISVFNLEDEQGNKIPKEKRPTHLALKTGKMVSHTYFIEKKDKTRFPIAITVTPVKQGRKIIGAVDIFRDITIETNIDRAKSEFVSLASHQLRTPLGIIKWYLEAVENEDHIKKAPATVKKYLAEIYKSNERVLSLVRDLLSVSRIDQGKIKNIPESVDIVKVVKEIVEQMKIVANKKKVILNLTIHDEKIPVINIDILRVHEVIENLIANAVEYSTSEGSVNVDVRKVNEHLLINIKDTGIGISLADQKMLYTKFFRTEKAVKHNPEGSGLGLYVVKSYVEDWGGKISAHSVEGKGSTFTISLPVTIKKDSPVGV